MSESNSTIDLGFEARLAHVVGTAQKWDRGVHPDELVKAIRELREYFYQRTADDAPARIGPSEPDDTMVICPVCTSQFRAIPLDVQRQLAFLSAPERGERGTSRLGSSARELPSAETAESADERESTADSPDRRDAAARVAAPEGRNRKPSDASLGKDAPGRFAMLKALNEAFEYGCAEIERLRDLIRTHNASCGNACAARSDAHCEPWLTRGRWCPDCPREWVIEDEEQKS